MSIAFIILTWNSQNDIKECIESIVAKCQGEQLDYEIHIIDNGSKDDTVKIIDRHTESNPRIKKKVLDKNYGTTLPRNLALREVTQEYVCIIDSDTKQLDGSLNKLLKLLKSDSSIGLIAPKLILTDGSVQHSVKKFPTLLDKLLKSFKIFGIGLYYQSDFYKNFPFTQIAEVDTAISACWFFRRSLLDEIGYLDENIFYAPEDVDFSMRIWKTGKKILFYPDYKIHHKTQQITHARPFSKISRSHFLGLLYYFRKHRYWFSRQRIYKRYLINH